MEFLVVIIIIASVLSKLGKQKKSAGRATPYAPPEKKGAQTPGNAAQTLGDAVKSAAESAQVFIETAKSGDAQPDARPFAPAMPRKPFTPAQPASGASKAPAGAPQDSARGGSLTKERSLLEIELGEYCDDGHGSIAHREHEGTEFHAPGAHSAVVRDDSPAEAAGPGDIAARPAMASRLNDTSGSARSDSASGTCDSGEETPELLGMPLDADAMRRAVVFSEIINKRGGRHGWVRT